VKNDQKKVQAILNEIRGLNHDGTSSPGVPAVFGMNFQAVSVGQKLAKDNSDGNCTDDTNFTGHPGGYLTLTNRWSDGPRRIGVCKITLFGCLEIFALRAAVHPNYLMAPG